MKKTCNTCSYAIITLIAECVKRNKEGDYLHMGGFCPEEMTCSHWEQADQLTIEENAIDWTKARIIEVD